MAREIEQAALSVLRHSFGGTPPVDVFAIARDEGIVLVPGEFTERFSGRIEYHHREGVFLLFHPELSHARFPNRVRFSIGHELAHYFLDHHRRRLIEGAKHSSASGFVSDDPMEREADEFAAALLIPETELRRVLSRRGFLVLSDVLKLAELWKTSPISSAIRYVKYASEACVVVLSQGDHVVFALASDEARAIGLGGIKKHMPLPENSASMKAWRSRAIDRPAESGISSADWMPSSYHPVQLWEEAVALGNTDWTLALLALSEGVVESAD